MPLPRTTSERTRGAVCAWSAVTGSLAPPAKDEREEVRHGALANLADEADVGVAALVFSTDGRGSVRRAARARAPAKPMEIA